MRYPSSGVGRSARHALEADDILRLAKRSADGLVSWTEQRRRSAVRIPVSQRQARPPRIYFLVGDVDAPIGGVRVMYRHVDILNSAGVPAAILHQQPGFRCSWFANETVLANTYQCAIGPQDVLVVPELDVRLIADRALQVRHIVFNQSGILTWQRDPDGVAAHYADSPGLLAIVTVSEYAAELLQFALPHRDIRRIRLGLDSELLHPPAGLTEHRISFMPRRGLDQANLLFNLLRNRPAFNGWIVDPIDGVDHAEVARRLRQSQVFLALSVAEGFGLPAAEAMACGNYVIGFHGMGGREFFKPEFCAPVATGDTLALAARLEEALELEAREPGWLRERGLLASRRVRSTYSLTNEAADVVRTYKDLLGA